MIKLNNVTKKYANGYEAIRQLSFTLESGKMVFLTGHSGAGKSTILKLIAGLEKPTRGDVWVNNQDLKKLSRKKLAAFRRDMGIVLQDPHLIADQTVFENIALPLIIEGFSRIEIGKRVRAALDKVGLLEKENYLPGELSTGQRQRIGLARAVVNKPVLLLADEPTGNLDPDLSREMMQLFSDFNQLGTTVLVATHDVELIQEFNYPVIHIEQGRLSEVHHG